MTIVFAKKPHFLFWEPRKGVRKVVLSPWCLYDSGANLLCELNGHLLPCTSCLYGKWVEYVCVLANLEYLSILFCAVLWAAALGLVAVLPMWDSAYVSDTVTSQTIGFPVAHDKRVVPSGRLLSSHIRHLGSLDRSPQDIIQMTVMLLSGSASAAG